MPMVYTLGFYGSEDNMSENNVFKAEIDAMKKHLSGKKKMTTAALKKLGQDLEVDIPYADDWRSHGYNLYEEWHLDHKDYLESLDEALELYNSIPEVAEMRK